MKNSMRCIAIVCISWFASSIADNVADGKLCEKGYFPCSSLNMQEQRRRNNSVEFNLNRFDGDKELKNKMLKATKEYKVQCVLQKFVCDGKVDCLLGPFDELFCDDASLDQDIDMKFRKRPTAEEDDDYDFTQLEENCFLDVVKPEVCECNRRNLICRHKNFTGQVPPLITATASANTQYSWPEIGILDLSGNYFPVLTTNTFAGLQRTVHTMILQHCQARVIHEALLDVFERVRHLHLDGNLLKYLPKLVGQFTSSPLELLTLRHNQVEHIDDGAFVHLESLLELDLSYNKLRTFNAESLLGPTSPLEILNLQGNELTRPSPFPPLQRLHLMSLAENRLIDLGNSSFAQLKNLTNLSLCKNRLAAISTSHLQGLQSLRSLILSDNELKDIENGAFDDHLDLNSLDLRGNSLSKRLSSLLFQPLIHLDYIYFDNFETCADAPHVRVCEPKSDGISSKDNLLDNIFLRTSVWMMALLGLLGNSVVLLGRYLGPSSNHVHSLYIKNLAFSDLLMASYLFFLAGIDLHYRGEYLRYEYSWRHSQLCSFLGFLNSLSGESSVLILSLVTWDRFVSVTKPLARKYTSSKRALSALLLLWSIAILVATVPLLPLPQTVNRYFGDEFYNSNGVCLPLFLHDPFDKGWQYSLVMFACINCLALVFISCAYYRMIQEIRSSSVACRSTQQNQDCDRVAHRFALIVLTDCLCWIPVVTIRLLTLAGLQMKSSQRNFVYAFLAIYVMPINCALNPVLYTLSTKLFKKQVRKWNLRRVLKGNDHHSEPHSGYDSAFSLSLGVLGGNRRFTFRGTQSSLAASKSWSRQQSAQV